MSITSLHLHRSVAGRLAGWLDKSIGGVVVPLRVEQQGWQAAAPGPHTGRESQPPTHSPTRLAFTTSLCTMLSTIHTPNNPFAYLSWIKNNHGLSLPLMAGGRKPRRKGEGEGENGAMMVSPYWRAFT